MSPYSILKILNLFIYFFICYFWHHHALNDAVLCQPLPSSSFLCCHVDVGVQEPEFSQ